MCPFPSLPFYQKHPFDSFSFQTINHFNFVSYKTLQPIARDDIVGSLVSIYLNSRHEPCLVVVGSMSLLTPSSLMGGLIDIPCRCKWHHTNNRISCWCRWWGLVGFMRILSIQICILKLYVTSKKNCQIWLWTIKNSIN